MRIQPFRALRPPRDLAVRVASLPYDIVDSDAARRLADGNPASFLHVVRPEIDLDPGVGLYDEAVYNQARQNFRQFIEKGYLVPDAEPGLFVYRLEIGDHSQSGVVCTCHVDDYEDDLIRKHERTLKSKEDDRTRHVAALGANAGPVFLTYPDRTEIDSLIDSAQWGPALCDFAADDGIRHTVWRVEPAGELVDAFAAVPTAYVADGHHRTASAARVGQERRKANPEHTGNEPYNWFLTVLFPARQLRVEPYNRAVADLHGLSADAFMRQVEAVFHVSDQAAPAPPERGRIRMYRPGAWLELRPRSAPPPDPVSSLDVSVLQDQLLGPVLGIDDPRTDPRIRFAGGAGSPEVLQTWVDDGSAAVAFSLHPIRVQDLIDIADAGRIMPPKSTWFEPKLRSGLFVHTLD